MPHGQSCRYRGCYVNEYTLVIASDPGSVRTEQAALEYNLTDLSKTNFTNVVSSVTWVLSIKIAGRRELGVTWYNQQGLLRLRDDIMNLLANQMSCMVSDFTKQDLRSTAGERSLWRRHVTKRLCAIIIIIIIKNVINSRIAKGSESLVSSSCLIQLCS